MKNNLVRLASFPLLNPNPVLEVDSSGKIIFCNDATIGILKDLGLEEDVRVFLPDDINSILTALAQKKTEPFYREIRIKDRTFREVLYLTTQFNAVRIYAHDISEGKKAANLLAESEAQFEAVFNAISDAAIFCDKERRVLLINPAATTLFGYTFEELKGKTTEVLYADKADYEEEGRRLYPEGSEPGRQISEIRYRRKNGEVFIAETLGARVRDSRGAVMGFFGIHRDITERKRAEEALRISEEEFRQIFDLSAVGMAQVNPKTNRYIRVNQKLCEISGYPEGELLEKTFMDITHPADRQRDMALYQELLHGKKEEWSIEKRYVRKNGEIIHVQVNGRLVRDADGRPLRSLAVVQDITGRKRLFELVRSSRDELEIRVQERTRELEKVNKAIEIERNYLTAILNGMKDGVYIINSQYDIEYINPAIEKEFGPVKGRKCHDYFHDLTEVCPWCKTQEVWSGASVSWEGHFHKTGKIYELFESPRINDDGSISKLKLLHDITERRQAEEVLRQKEELLRNVLETMPVGVWILNESGKIIHGNSAGQKIWRGANYSDMEQNLEHKGCWIDTGKLIEPHEWAAVRAMTKGQQIIDEEVELECLDGTHKIILNSAVPLINSRQESIGTIIVNQDITGRKQIESRIQATSAILKLFTTKSSRKDYLDSAIALLHEWTDCSCLGIRMLDQNGNIPYESYVGFSHDFWESENWISVKKHQCACTRVIMERPEPQDFPWMTPSGSFRCDNTIELLNRLSEEERARFRGVCIQSGFKSVAIIPIRYMEKVLGAIHLADKREGMVPLDKIEFIESITPLVGEALQRFSAEASLHKSEASLSEAQRIAHLGNWDWDIKTNELHWSDEIYRMFGLSPQQFGATYDAFLEFVHPDDRQSVENAVNTALNEKKPYSIEHRIVWPNGTIRMVHERGEVRYDDRGEAIRMIGTVQDITEQNKIEEDLRNSHEQLRSLYSHLQSVTETERIRIAREIHDEFGTTLTALKMDISELAKNLRKDQKALKEKAETALSVVDSAAKTVQRIASELRPGILDHLGLEAAIEWQVKECTTRTGIKASTSIALDHIHLDRELSTTLFRIVQETLTNIIRHAEATRINVSLEEQDGFLILKVIDNGRGVTEKELSASNSFGLMGIRERVQYWYGEAEIKGIKNKGTTVTVRIPLGNKEEQ